jgi:ferredoxin-type protein NapH
MRRKQTLPRENPMARANKAGFRAYVATPIMVIILYIIASTVFYMLFRDVGTVIFFVILAAVLTSSMSLYALVPNKVKNGIRIVCIYLISLLLFGLACILGRQNFQIEGFLFYLLTGTFGGVMVHFLVGKIVGPLFVGRTWCSWGCWDHDDHGTLPFKTSLGWKQVSVRKLKYFHMALSLTLVTALVFGIGYTLQNPEQTPDQPGPLRALYWFLAGNALYYSAGVIMAFVFKDNRAFCKYLCPFSLLLKLSNCFSMLRIRWDQAICKQCNTCVENCPSNIEIPKYLDQGGRVKSSECLMCMKCVSVCPEKALWASIGFDLVTTDYLKKDRPRLLHRSTLL